MFISCRLLGGTIWKILKEGEEEIIYAVDYNHHKERFFNYLFIFSFDLNQFFLKRHLNGCVLDSINKPTLLITDSYNFLFTQQKRRNRDARLLGIEINKSNLAKMIQL